MPEIVLASQSPRRQELLKHAFFSFITVPSNADETLIPDALPEQNVMEIAKRKAQDVAQRVSEGALIISADTIVVCEGEILGKPRDESEARMMLRKLSGREHQVFTGIVLMQDEKILTEYEVTRVQFKELSDTEIQNYIQTGEPMDKAGAYGIQDKGAFLVSSIHGDYFNVVGLPLCRLGMMLKAFDILIL